MPLENNLGERQNQNIEIYDEKHSIIDDLGNREVSLKKNIRQAPKKIDSQFDLDEDNKEDSVEKYGSDLDISSEDESNDEGIDQMANLDSNRRGNVPHSMPINVDFGINPMTKRPRSPIARLDKKEKNDKIPHGSIYENMQELSRSIQPADYRNRVLGTRPDNAGISMSYSSYNQLTRPRVIICNEPAKRLDVTLEATPDLET